MGTGSSKFIFSKSLNWLTFLVLIFQIEYGTRFYGFEEEISDCSYATIDIISGKAAFSTLHFTFKTKEESGVLLYSEKNVSNIAFPFDFLRESNNCFILISFKVHWISHFTQDFYFWNTTPFGLQTFKRCVKTICQTPTKKWLSDSLYPAESTSSTP